jgi:hypothetical protein
MGFIGQALIVFITAYKWVLVVFLILLAGAIGYMYWALETEGGEDHDSDRFDKFANEQPQPETHE